MYTTNVKSIGNEAQAFSEEKWLFYLENKRQVN